MPASAPVRPRERLVALAAVALVQLGLGAALLSGFRVDVLNPKDLVSQLIDVTIPPPPPPPQVRIVQPRPAKHQTAAAPKAAPKPIGGSPGPRPSHALSAPTPVVAIHPTAAASGGGSGSGPALGSGAGGGTGGQGYGGEDEGGTDLVQIAGAILPSDYPKDLGNARIGGHVSVTFTVQVDGRVSGCHVTRSSGIAELDALTCRLIEQRFRFRPSTDRFGRPVAEEVDYDHDWVASRGW